MSWSRMRVLVEGAFSLGPGWVGLLPLGGVRFLPLTKLKCFFILRQSRSSIEGSAWACRGKLDPHGCTAASSCPLHLLCCLSVSSSSRPWSTICNSPVYSLGFPTLVCSVLQSQLKDKPLEPHLPALLHLTFPWPQERIRTDKGTRALFSSWTLSSHCSIKRDIKRPSKMV